MKDLFVPRNLSLRLKKLGFDEPCLGMYSERENDKGELLYGFAPYQYFNHPIENVKDNITLAPTWDQIFDWILKTYNIHVFPSYTFYDRFYYYYEIVLPNGNVIKIGDISNIPDEFLIQKDAKQSCLVQLIEILENENKQV